MEKRFYVANPKIEDLINYTGDDVDLVGWSYHDGNVYIKNWNFINYKGSTKGYSKRVHLNALNFVDCVFKDVNFAGAVPMHKCTFKRCKFENCILTDHIRWNTFDNCNFIFCLFSGYFHGSTFKKNCIYENVLFEFYGGDSFFNGKKVTNKDYEKFENDILSKNTKTKYEILEYFYPIEMSEIKNYIIGNNYYFLRTVSTNAPKSRIVIIDEKEYCSDIIKDIHIKLYHYKPEIRIEGSKYHIEIEDCKYKI